MQRFRPADVAVRPWLACSRMTEESWDRRSEWPLNVLAVVFLIAYAWPILQPDIAPLWIRVCDYVAWGSWACFGVDYVVRLTMSNGKWIFIRTHLLDLIILVLPMMRPLRAVRAVMALRQLAHLTATSFRGRTLMYVGVAATLIIFIAALAVLDAERGHPNANIVDFPDALWWAASTVLTVGYGDRVPITLEGRLVGVGLMVAGSRSSASSPPHLPPGSWSGSASFRRQRRKPRINSRR